MQIWGSKPLPRNGRPPTPPIYPILACSHDLDGVQQAVQWRELSFLGGREKLHYLARFYINQAQILD